MGAIINGVAKYPLVTEGVAGNVMLQPGTQVARVDTTAARSVDLPTAACYDGNVVKIVDVTGGAGLNNITVTTQGAETIDGLASVAMAEAFGSITFVSDGSNWFTCAD